MLPTSEGATAPLVTDVEHQDTNSVWKNLKKKIKKRRKESHNDSPYECDSGCNKCAHSQFR